MRTLTPTALVALAAGALAVGGCGSSKSSSSTAASTYPGETTSPATTSSSAATGAATRGAPAASTASGATTAGGAGTVVAVKHAGKLGAVLDAGQKRLTVYLFEGDRGGTSACSGACASVWPPVTTSGAPRATGAAAAADLGTIKRPDGTIQVTYKGHPLYFFARDKDAGDTYGEDVNGFGASWYALSPSGAKVDNS